jgi:AcrR family transcriptional regulator
LFGFRYIGPVTASGRRPGKAAIMRAAVEVIAEDGFEGASTRDMAARAGVSVAALYHHFPSKLGLLREFLDEAYAVTLARIERRLDGVDGAVARLETVVGTLVWTHLHDDFAQRASIVAVREYTRLDRADRAAVEVQRKALLDLVEGIVRDGIRTKVFRTPEPRETARAIVSLATSVVGVYAEIGRPLDDVIALYQRFAVNLAGASGSRRRA